MKKNLLKNSFTPHPSPHTSTQGTFENQGLRYILLSAFCFLLFCVVPFFSSAQAVTWGLGGPYTYTSNQTFDGDAYLGGIMAGEVITIEVSANATVTVTGRLINNSALQSYTLNKTGAGTLIIEQGVKGNTEYSFKCIPTLKASQGVLQIGNGAKTTTNEFRIFVDGGTFCLKPGGSMSYGGETYQRITGTNGQFQYDGNSSKPLYLTADHEYSGTTTVFSGGVLYFGNGSSGSGSVAGYTQVNANAKLIFNHNTNKQFGGNQPIGGTGNVEKMGGGTLTLTSHLTFSGTATVHAGEMHFNSSVTTGLNFNVDVKSGATFRLSTPFSIMNFKRNITGSGLFIANCPTLDLSGDNISVAQINVLSGRTLTISGNSTADITSNISLDGTINYNRTSNYAATGKFVSGGGVVNKNGSGTLSFTYPDNMAEGTFYLNEGTLNFSGDWMGNFVKKAASTLVIEGNPKIWGKLIMQGGETFINPNGSNFLNVFWALEASGTNVLNIGGMGTASSYTLLTANSGVSTDNFVVIGTNYSLSATPTTLSLVFVPVTGISNVPTTATATVPLTLSGLVEPVNAVNQSITWSVNDAGSTAAAISGNTLYTAYAGTVVVTATITNGASPTTPYSKNFTITVNKASQNPPAMPTIHTSHSTSITLNTISGCEYSRDGGAWQSSPTFSGLSPSTQYTFTQRYAETPSHNASPSSPAAQFTTPSPEYTPIKGIYLVPTTAIAGTPLTLTGTIEPDDATNQAMIWSVADAGTTGATIEGTNVLHTKGAGTVTVKVTIINGLTPTSPFEKNFAIVVSTDPNFVPATDIINVPTSIPADVSFKLTGTVVPNNATNQAITWSILNDGGTDAFIADGDTFFASTGGNVMILATVKDGKTFGVPLTKGFNVTVAPFVSVEDIVDVPTTFNENTLTLSGTVLPADAFNKKIVWSVAYAGFTGATITGNVLTVAAAGTLVVRATIENGKKIGESFTKEFVLNATVGITSAELSNQIVVYPNPTTGELRIENGELRIKGVEVYDAFGKKQLSIVNCQLSIEKIDISNFSAGIYFVRITTENGIVTKKVLKH